MSSEQQHITNTAEASQAEGISPNLKTASKRLEYSNCIDHVIELARKKLMNRWVKCPEKISWARIAIQAASSGNEILKDSELEDLSRRLDAVELEMKKNAHSQ